MEAGSTHELYLKVHNGTRVCKRTGMSQAIFRDQFAGNAVSDYAAALNRYERLLGYSPAFFPAGTEAVWELAEHPYLCFV